MYRAPNAPENTSPFEALDAHSVRSTNSHQEFLRTMIQLHDDQQQSSRALLQYMDDKAEWRSAASNVERDLEKALRDKSRLESDIKVSKATRVLYTPGAPAANTFMATFYQNMIDSDSEALVRAIRLIDDCEKALQLHETRRPHRPTRPVGHQPSEIRRDSGSNRPQVGGGAFVTAVEDTIGASDQGTAHRARQGDTHHMVYRDDPKPSLSRDVNNGVIQPEDSYEGDEEQVVEELCGSDA